MTKTLNPTFGATLIVAGTSIGAAMLALPLISASLGFLTSSCILIVMWGIMTMSALIMVKLNLKEERPLSIAGLAEKHLGSAGKFLGSSSILLLFYSLLAAYIAGGSSILLSFADGISPRIMQVLFTLILAFPVYHHLTTVDAFNRGLFFLKMFFFLLVVISLSSHVETTFLQAPPVKEKVLWTLPVFFTSFGFHGSIPPLMEYVGSDYKKLKKVFILGSGIPLLIYLGWEAVTLGVLPQKGAISFANINSHHNELRFFIGQLRDITGSDNLKMLVQVFKILAIVTSFLGVAIGLFDYIREIRKSKENTKARIENSLLTFLLPLGLTLFYPQAFIKFLGLAGIALSMLAIVLPTLICLKQQKKLSYILLLLFGLLIIGIETQEVLQGLC